MLTCATSRLLLFWGSKGLVTGMTKRHTQNARTLRLVGSEPEANPAVAPGAPDHTPIVERPPGGNLPVQLTSFVGREREVSEVEGLLSDHRLVTLTGPGGSGKTRLALAVAIGVAASFEDGVWLIELAPLSDPDLVPQAVAQALGVREVPGQPLTEKLAAHLQGRKVLLVLDNCEHLVEACAMLSDRLLRSCLELRVLATSRETLSIAGEYTWLVPSLLLPDRERLAVEELGRFEAIRLFVERTRAVRPGFEITEQNARVIAQICQ